MAIKNLDSNFRLSFFPERISVQSTVNDIFWKESSFIKLKVRGTMGGEEMGNDWLIWIKIGPMLGFFFFCTNPVWHLSQEKYKTNAICAEPASADVQTLEELTQIIFCSFISISLLFSFFIFPFWHFVFHLFALERMWHVQWDYTNSLEWKKGEDICRMWFKTRCLEAGNLQSTYVHKC